MKTKPLDLRGHDATKVIVGKQARAAIGQHRQTGIVQLFINAQDTWKVQIKTPFAPFVAGVIG